MSERERSSKREAMELIDEGCKHNDEVCQAIVNLHPLDAYIASVRESLRDTQKQSAVADQMKALKNQKVYTDAVQKVNCGDAQHSPVTAVSEVLALSEALSVIWQDLPKERITDGELAAAVQSSFTEFGGLLRKIVLDMLGTWEGHRHERHGPHTTNGFGGQDA